MRIYDALVIGSGYASVGFARKNKNVIICEEHQICDTGFYLPARCYEYFPYCTKTQEGKKLESVFAELSLFSGEQQNLNGFECAMCTYLVNNPVELLLKSKVIGVKRMCEGVYDVSVYTNEGITHLFTKRVINTKRRLTQKKITVLFTTGNIARAKETLCSVFEGAQIEPAFYEGRYAMHVNADGFDENSVKLWIYNKWCETEPDAKILYIAPVFYGDAVETHLLCDANYTNPIEAFEAGYLFSLEDEE